MLARPAACCAGAACADSALALSLRSNSPASMQPPCPRPDTASAPSTGSASCTRKRGAGIARAPPVQARAGCARAPAGSRPTARCAAVSRKRIQLSVFIKASGKASDAAAAKPESERARAWSEEDRQCGSKRPLPTCRIFLRIIGQALGWCNSKYMEKSNKAFI
jgi:hypothetical protein